MIQRIKEVRKALDLTQEEFGERINLKQNSIALLEKGKRNPSDRTISDICREFSISESWLRTGEGQMFIQLPPEDEYMKAASEISMSPEDDIIRKVIIEYWRLTPEGKKHLKDFIRNIANNIEEKD